MFCWKLPRTLHKSQFACNLRFNHRIVNMSTIIDQVKAYFLSWKPEAEIKTIKQLAQAGSDRLYFRVETSKRHYIVTYNDNVRENAAFLEFSKHFNSKQLSVPEIFHQSDDKRFYIQSDLGNISLF